MKKSHKILLYLIFLILTAGNAAAWSTSFENHPSDISTSLISSNLESGVVPHSTALTRINTEHTNCYVNLEPSTTPPQILISKVWDGYFAFSDHCEQSGYAQYTGETYPGITLYNSSGGVIGTGYFTGHYIETGYKWGRIEYIQTGTTITCYLNGNSIGTITISDDTDYGYFKIIFQYSRTDGSLATKQFIDDLSSTPYIIGCAGELYTDSTLYFSYGYPRSSNYVYSAQLYGPAGENLSTISPLADATSESVSESSFSGQFSDPGTYTIRLFRTDPSAIKYFLTSKTVSVVSLETASNSIELDKSEYAPGDTIKVWTYVPDFTPLSYTDSGYKIAWRVYTDAYAGEDGEETKDVLSYDLTSIEQWGTLVLPDDVPAGVGKEVRLVNPDGQDVAIATYDVLTDYNPSVEWSQDTYELNDTAKLLISQAPTGSTITFRVYSQNTLMQETTLDVTSSTGSKAINLADYTTGDKLLAILKNADGYILDQDYATVRIGDYIVSGRVYDALTGAAVPGATVHIYTEDATTDSIGSYSLTARAGQWAVEISADGYNTYSGHVTIQDLISTRNFYIVPILEGETSGLYGTVTSWATSKPLEGVLVTITKDSTTYSTTTNSRGYYKIEKSGLNGTCTVQISKSNYDTYSGYVSVSGMTLLQVHLVANTNYDEGTGGGEEDTSSPSSSSSISTSDRPDREAAKSTLTWLESSIPGLIQIIVLAFILGLFGVKF